MQCTLISQIKLAVLFALFASVVGMPALADPPGFRKIRITNSPSDVDKDPCINDRGDIVWYCRRNNVHRETEIYLYSDSKTTRLTNDHVTDAWPDLNNNGVIAWIRFDGPNGDYGPTGEVVRWENGNAEVIYDNESYVNSPKLNDSNDIVWWETTNFKPDCGNAPVDGIRAYLNGEVVDIFDDDMSHQGPVIGADGKIVWAVFDFCQDGIPSKVLQWDRGEMSVLCDGPTPMGPSIAANGVMAWFNDGGIDVWDGEQLTRITDDGGTAIINSKGDIALNRWNNRTKLWEAWLYLGGEFRLIAASSNWELENDMNERGDIVVFSCTKAIDHSEIFLYKRLPDGDMNCDEKVDFDDIDGFVEAITDRATYEKNNKTCDWWLADCNGDRKIDFNDIDAFIDCLINGGCP